MKKIECLVKSFRMQPLSLAFSEHRERWVALWRQDVTSLSQAKFLERTSGAQFTTTNMPMTLFSVLVEDQDLDFLLSVIREAVRGDEHEDEALIVSDYNNARSFSLVGS